MSVSLNVIVDVNVEVSNPTTISSDFNLGLVIGNSTVLTAQNRVRLYSRDTFQTQMVSDGFTTASPEYKAAVAYFGQSPAPATLAVGVQLAEETTLQAITACRAFNENVYAISFATETQDTDIPGIAAAVEAFGSPTIFFYQTKDENCLEAGQTNVMKTLMESSYNRSCGFYSTQANFINGLMGVVCGLNSMQANSAYTLAYKSVTGFTPEAINDVQLSALASCNGNVYCQFGRRYNFVYPGVMAGGYHADEQFLIDAIYFLVQQNTVAGLVSRRVVPQTESGVTDIISFITNGCEALRVVGFIATGIWTGGDVLELTSGDAVPGGYLIQAGSLAEQSAEDRKARKSPPIYVALKASGAIEHVVVRVYVNQ